MMIENTQTTTKETKRTLSQNSALHLYYQLLADVLNTAGLDMKIILKPEVNISWTKDNVKNYLWRPFQKALTTKKSTTQLNKVKEIDIVFEHLHRHLSEKFGAFAEFPQFPSMERNFLEETPYQARKKKKVQEAWEAHNRLSQEEQLKKSIL